MIPVRHLNGQQVAVLGLGRSGLAAARALKAGGASPIVWDDNAEALTAAEDESFQIKNLHSEEVWREHSFSALLLSPGIPHLYPAPHPIVRLAWKYGAQVDNDVSLFFETLMNLQMEADDFSEVSFADLELNLDLAPTAGGQGPKVEPLSPEGPLIVAITGSNGKSTTTALTHHILQNAGRNAQIGGNIGRGVLDLDPPRSCEIYVIELSSYQTELANMLAPDIAVFLNISPDHLDRHGGAGGYFAAKARLFSQAPALGVVGVDEPGGAYLANKLLGMGVEVTPVTAGELELLKDHVQPFGQTVSLEAARICDRLFEWGEMTSENYLDLGKAPNLRGRHNHQNAAAAYAVCRALGLSQREIEQGMNSFAGLPHRMERVGAKGDVVFVNDSKATNIDAAARALDAYENIYWIAGGQAKEGGLEGLKPHLSKVKKAYLIGEAADLFAALLGDLPFERSTVMAQAVAQATADAASSGGPAVVLLAPACASFDQFRNFELRGEAFRSAAKAQGAV